MRATHIVLGLLALLCASCVRASALAPLHRAEPGKAVTGEYIVLMREDMQWSEWETYLNATRFLFTKRQQGNILNVWSIGDTFKAIHVSTSDDGTLTALRSHPDVELVEENHIKTIATFNEEDEDDACSFQNNAIWNLQRLNTHPISGMDGRYSYDQLASNVDAYIIDTGILITHDEFRGRALWGTNFVNDGRQTDCNGHGTHVAGTVGGSTVGVARGATLIAVKVLGCDGSGSSSGVISGIQWVATSARNRGRKSVANMSLGGAYSATENRAVAAVVDAGVPFAVAAGNEDQDACNTSPASEPKAITTGATFYTGAYSQDIRASFSNWGSCVDVLAPGQNIKSAWIGSSSSYSTISGTSMASPHVCGVAAIVYGNNPSFSAANVKAKILADSTANIIDLRCTKSGCPSTPNKMLFTSRC